MNVLAPKPAGCNQGKQGFVCFHNGGHHVPLRKKWRQVMAEVSFGKSQLGCYAGKKERSRLFSPDKVGGILSEKETPS